MTKVEQIRELYDGMRSTSEIAAIVGCRPAYVRVVARQRKFTGKSDCDRRYVEKVKRETGRDPTSHRYFVNERARIAARAYSNARGKAIRAGHDVEKARALGRRASEKARRQYDGGKS